MECIKNRPEYNVKKFRLKSQVEIEKLFVQLSTITWLVK